ncbi:MAG TPA: hypothetical protein PKY22_09655 [Accumulibacter sp.]|nr:hypothetical protein [Accumulibacter sp.]
MNETLLIELCTEELPPKSLSTLSDALAQGVFAALQAQQLLTADSRCQAYATQQGLPWY